MGSPPRMRGKASQYATSRPAARITPACAGKRAGRCPDGCTPWDHPRVCGEKCLSNHLTLKRGGSPPRVRGKESCHPDFFREIGITPACAGKRTCTATRRCGNGDHPRVCGEKIEKQGDGYAVLGSPPRMRGKDGVNDSAQAVTGITPACAGKRRMPKQCVFNFRDHPRVCGEKGIFTCLMAFLMGSPPHMRGKVLPPRM